MRPEDNTGFPGSGVTDDCELPRESWEQSLALREEQPVL